MNTTTFLTDTDRWEAVRNRNPQADAAFVYGVISTGVYCRPHCASRRPKRENVRFFDSAALAEQAGFRACKRCAPQARTAPDKTAEAVTQACALLARASEAPSLLELAEAVGMSPAHLQRMFKKVLGVSPKQYAMEIRMQRAREGLRGEATITAAVYAAGFDSGSRFYENTGETLGMTPTAYRGGGKGQTISYALAQSRLGLVLVAATAKGVCRIDFGENPEDLLAALRDAFPRAALQEGGADLEGRLDQALACLTEPERAASLPLDVRGTAFQRQVWAALRTIPAGTTSTYAEIASRLGKPGAARAVGRACALNAIAVAIPCHRVIRGDGSLAGYRWGIERKRALLDSENGEGK